MADRHEVLQLSTTEVLAADCLKLKRFCCVKIPALNGPQSSASVVPVLAVPNLFCGAGSEAPSSDPAVFADDPSLPKSTSSDADLEMFYCSFYQPGVRHTKVPPADLCSFFFLPACFY
ncbi:hypothetical protein GOODEAATRI_030545 [Goodea atripinnis]|uniref:Uncharacterized protein n=1 Tax=Goodea atripinnis TaxID=208336 RepID=A0ABV0N5I2_9TELE